MFGMFKKKLNEGATAVKKFEKKDLMEATIAAAFLVAGADGEIEPSELDKLEKVIRNDQALAPFGTEVQATINRYKSMVQEGGMLIARTKLMREIGDVKADPQECEDVFVVAVTIAMADGQIEPAEQKILVEIARKLNLNPADFFEVDKAA